MNEQKRQEMNNINERIKEIITKVKHLMNGDLSNPTEHLNTIVTKKVIDINGILYNILRILNNKYILSRHCRGIEVEVYNFDSESKEYYLDSTFLNAGDVLYKLDGQETYTVSKRASLTGVYNMNKGYADFKQIIILYQNDEYAIVKSNTKYGLNVYDYIVLNAESVSDDQFIN